MSRTGLAANIYTVVEVVRGVATGAYSFVHFREALLCAEQLRAGRNMQEDDVQIFKTTIDLSPRGT